MEGAEAPTTCSIEVDPDQENIVTYAYTFEDLFFEGEAWWHVTRRNFADWPTFAEHVDHNRIMVDAGRGRVYLDEPIPTKT